jgi:hypothetical protein
MKPNSVLRFRDVIKMRHFDALNSAYAKERFGNGLNKVGAKIPQA